MSAAYQHTTCPHCNERTEINEPLSFPFEDGEIVEESETCLWCERPFTVSYKARVEYELVEVKA